jgi:hypothetical protein
MRQHAGSRKVHGPISHARAMKIGRVRGARAHACRVETNLDARCSRRSSVLTCIFNESASAAFF